MAIEGITDKDIQKLIEIYKGAEKEILAVITAVDFTKRAEKEKTLKQIQNILQDLYNPTSKFIERESAKEYESGIENVRKALADVGFKGSFNLVDPKATEFILGNLSDTIELANNDVRQVLSNSYLKIQNALNLVTKEVKNDLLSEIGKGQILGKARKEISRRMIDTLTEKGITGFNYVTNDGKQRSLSLPAYVEGLTRSTLINSRASAVTSTALEMGHDLLKISTHRNESPMCSPWSGKIVSISGKTPGYPALTEALFNGDYRRGGIFHRYCRHSLTVYIPTEIKFN